MKPKRKLPSICPSCEKPLTIGELFCDSCDTKVVGSFELPALMRLSETEQEFVLAFVKCGGSLKQMAEKLSLSYPTVRNLLDDIISKL